MRSNRLRSLHSVRSEFYINADLLPQVKERQSEEAPEFLCNYNNKINIVRIRNE